MVPKLLKAAFLLVILVSGAFLYQQDEFTLTFEYVETIRYNPEYFWNFKCISFKYNRTNVAMNNTMWAKQDFGNILKLEIQAYRFASNEYRLFPLRFSFNFCDSIAKDDFGLKDIYNCGNFSGCPLKKGHYFSCNWAPNDRKFPPHIPEGRYMLDLKYFLYSTEIAFYRIYGTVKYLIKWENSKN